MPEPHLPTLRDLLALDIPMDVRVSPDGTQAAISVRRTNWNQNSYDNLCLVYTPEHEHAVPLTRAGSVAQMEWIDDHTLALLKSSGGDGDKPQVWLYEHLAGEGWQVTEHKTGVDSFKPFAGGLLFRASDPKRDEKKARQDKFGTLLHFEQEDSASALYYTNLDQVRHYQDQLRAATEDEAKKLTPPVVELSKLLDQPLHIAGIVPSPRGDAVYLNCRPRDDLVYYRQGSVYCLQVDAPAALEEHLRRDQEKKAQQESAGEASVEAETPEKEDFSYLGRLTRLNLPARASVVAVSPDGAQLLIEYQGRDEKMYTRPDMWIIDTAAALSAPDEAAFVAAMRNITAPLDQIVLTVHWVESGIYGLYYDGTQVRLARFHGDGGYTVLELRDQDDQPRMPWYDFHVSPSGVIGMPAAGAGTITEACLARPDESGGIYHLQFLTDTSAAVADWSMGTVETIRWISKDGVEIEGVLRKPLDFDPTKKKYPLVFVVHGGPTSSSLTYLLSGEDLRYYPSVQFANQGVLVLKPNYRGSIGRGQAFMELNVDNLGVGDLWDLESAVDHLVNLGWVDPERVGCMGWSQGGYISAFAGLHSKKFKAVSVGAGVSDWYTYHISNDIPDFTVDYLSASPFRQRDSYIKTAPISGLPTASTPMLIQHGSDDRRVPLSNATELYRGLKEMGIPVELFIYPGMAHPITKPRQNHAVLHQNLSWFSHYLLGTPLDLTPK